MFLAVLAALLARAGARELSEPTFQVLTPDELVVEVPRYGDVGLVTFRMGVRRESRDDEDFELGENDIDNSRIFVYDRRLNLKKGDTVNYLLALRDRDGYQAKTGKYVFDGVYYKKPSSRRLRFRRHLSLTTEKSEYNTEEDTEELEPRFGGGFRPRHHPRRHWPDRGMRPQGFGPFGPPHGYPPFGPPSFGGDCNDHRHDMCHSGPNSPDDNRWQSGTVTDVEYHCKICKKFNSQRVEGTTPTTTTTTSTSTEYSPDIDIRFSD